MKKMTKDFYYWLDDAQEDIEKFRQKEMYEKALQYAGNAVGYIKLAYLLDIIEKEEFILLINKFQDYYDYYYYIATLNIID